MNATDTLYETDFVAWAEREGAALRRAAAERPNLLIDWENVAEEVESLARSEARRRTARLLQKNPSLRPRLPELLEAREDAVERVGYLLSADLAGIAACEAQALLARTAAAMTDEQVMGDWWPELPDAR